MKIAVLADIHGNIQALESTAAHVASWQPDAVVVAGDIVNRGPRSAECLAFVQQKQLVDDWQVVRGNHEDYVLDRMRPDAPRSGPRFDIAQNAHWTYQELDGQVADLAAMPFQVSLSSPDGGELRIVHASMKGNRDGIYPESTDDEIQQKIAPPSAVICVGHTHRPLIRMVDDTLVVNVGAVGIPFDGDPRPSYAQVSWRSGSWRARIVRLCYDRASAEYDYYASGFVDGGGPLTKIMLSEFRQARSYIHIFIRDYEEAILAGEISTGEAVDRFLKQYGLTDIVSK